MPSSSAIGLAATRWQRSPHDSKEPRALYWTPDDLTAAERDRLIDFAAYRQLVGDYRNKDTAEAKDVLTWVADRLKGDIGTIYKIVPDSFSRGRIAPGTTAT